ncbi:Hypothetical predicted protein [Olea europaea subsp. europaea]|uniref:Uncharacterized protein n=1 Tax=Olea europaea subsp. europaea TaxID=158383 RepID=A0A8S0UEP9_OLEEU|nr:Hypothetical predicted protein [Olea europaea subsp. europaea]
MSSVVTTLVNDLRINRFKTFLSKRPTETKIELLSREEYMGYEEGCRILIDRSNEKWTKQYNFQKFNGCAEGKEGEMRTRMMTSTEPAPGEGARPRMLASLESTKPPSKYLQAAVAPLEPGGEELKSEEQKKEDEA